ncbi:hypothetical protein [Niallia endozanthoxylica]|uniref:Uncharacterized protein n=1 Tax=Niallia endozanthoxylica TaxID=2036016 RepID=A0A5J5HRF7_9BACI|nr:hypothetical protein [Niallia endozanthoxylica]KAA9023144.1 hypothetical protein F4V44_13670 [Niallia endozanthoxylica]
MIKNERGSTLVVVMLMLMVFTVLGLAIISTSIGGAKRTEIREEQVTNDLDAIRHLNEAVAYIKETINQEFNIKNPDMSIRAYQNLIQDDIIDNKYQYQIANISNTYETINESEDFTRVLQVTSGNYTQKVYITGMPSFLKYAVGSRGTLTLNGSTYVEEGNIYASDKIIIANEAKYIFNGDDLVEKTTFPSVASNKSLLFLENENIDLCNYNCYSEKTKNNGSFHSLKLENLDDAFDPTSPTYSKDNTEFVEVDIEKTFKEKLQTAGFVDDNANPYNMDINQMIANGRSRSSVKLITSFKDIDNDPSIEGYLYVSPSQEDTYIEIDNLTLDKSKWLVFDGNAIIENIGRDPMNVSANILVTGDLTLRGAINFNSTIYVFGNTTINNVDIKGLNDGELILMTQGQLEIARINKFTEDKSSIKAYLYTNQDAEVYAMGSYLYVEGGIFARGNLEVNAYRGSAEDEGTGIKFTDNDNETASRLIIKNNKKLFMNQEQGLPKINQLEVMTDLMKKE